MLTILYLLMHAVNLTLKKNRKSQEFGNRCCVAMLVKINV